MGFLDALRAAEIGVRMDWPEEVAVEDEAPSGVNLLDERFQVGWHIGFSMMRMDLDATNDRVLRQDTEYFTRSAFQSATPRTEAPGWSPVIDFARMAVHGGDALLCVYRQSYEPSNEVVAGELSVPVADGTLTVGAYAAAATTGVRESVLAASKMSEGGDPESPDFLRQSAIDDPALDEQFPETPLARVRKALRWRLNAPRMEVTEPPGVRAAGPVRLARAGCSVMAPPRYLPCTAIAEMMSPTLDLLVRVAPPSTTARMIDVWRVDAPPVTGWMQRRKLKQLAVQTVEEWKAEGATDIRVSPVDTSEQDGRLQVDFSASFVVGDDPTQSVQRWFLDTDGQVHRVVAGGPLAVPTEELAADVDHVARSWQPL